MADIVSLVVEFPDPVISSVVIGMVGPRGPVGPPGAGMVHEADEPLHLKSPNGHYWKFEVDNNGVMTSEDAGTTHP